MTTTHVLPPQGRLNEEEFFRKYSFMYEASSTHGFYERSRVIESDQLLRKV